MRVLFSYKYIAEIVKVGFISYASYYAFYDDPLLVYCYIFYILIHLEDSQRYMHYRFHFYDEMS